MRLVLRRTWAADIFPGYLRNYGSNRDTAEL